MTNKYKHADTGYNASRWNHCHAPGAMRRPKAEPAANAGRISYMISVYSFSIVWVAIVLAGIVGCIATAGVVQATGSGPFSAVAGNVYKYVWSVIFAIPMPFLLGFGGLIGLVLAFIWLDLAPTVASKVYFGPKEAPWQKLMTFHAGYGVAALIVYYIIIQLG
jgi:hypothetical protein